MAGAKARGADVPSNTNVHRSWVLQRVPKVDGAQHIIFSCMARVGERAKFEASTENHITPETLMEMILTSPQDWATVAIFTDLVMRAKVVAERE